MPNIDRDWVMVGGDWCENMRRVQEKGAFSRSLLSNKLGKARWQMDTRIHLGTLKSGHDLS